MGRKLWLYLVIGILLVFFILKFGEKTHIVKEFPLDGNNDLASYLAKLHFLDKYGYHEVVPNWYNGEYVLFSVFPPMWYFFTYPILSLTKSLELATLVSYVVIYLIGFLSIWFLLKDNFSGLKRIALFLLIFANPLAVGNFVRLGRPHELLSWVAFVILFISFLKYEKKDLDNKFYLLAIPYALILLSHVAVFIIASFLFLGLFIVKNKIKDRLKIIGLGILTAALASFWLIPFLSRLIFDSSSFLFEGNIFSRRLIDIMNPLYYVENATSFAIAFAFLALFFLYKKTNRIDLKFYAGVLLIAVLFFLRVVPFIPVLRRIYPDVYNMFLVVIGAYFLVSMKMHRLSYSLRNVIKIGTVVFVVLSVVAYLLFIPGIQKHTQNDINTIKLIENIEEKFLIISPRVNIKPFYSYAAIYHNLETPDGYSWPSAPYSLIEKIDSVSQVLDDCAELSGTLEELEVGEIISYNERCLVLEECGFERKLDVENACLFRVI